MLHTLTVVLALIGIAATALALIAMLGAIAEVWRKRS
jgi:hypothetical protein